jgi:hypothetical protein
MSDEGSGVTCIRLVSGKGESSIVLSSDGIWVPERPRSEVPDFMGLMIGTALDSRWREEGMSSEADLGGLIEGCRDPREIERRLVPHATKVPYSYITRAFLARPGRFRRAKLAFDSFDSHQGRVFSRQFRVLPEDFSRLEEVLSSVLTDRLEKH